MISKWIKDLNVRSHIEKLLEENIGRTLWHKLQQQFLYVSWSKGNNSKNKEMELIKLKSYCTARESINKMKRQPTNLEKIFANEMTDKGLISNIYKQLTQLNIKNKNNLIKKWQMNWVDIFPKRKCRWLTCKCKDAQHHQSSIQFSF